ncbi:PD-(D/E)XK nuclease family protein [Fulvimarina sp. MAC3]|uniref:PDDEXK-like family protein n=1 Tax=Fulvimarina sp. MAC3 TaxID=3148887 RepID=UPI0031FD850F
MSEQASPSEEELESLFVNNGELNTVEAYLNRFNPIKTMRMEGMEIRHSAILSWLFDPRETHGFSDKFLRAFLCEAMRGQKALGSPTALEISQSDLRDAVVRREWQNIDVFIMLPTLKWAFIIENKFKSGQHEGQLAKYARNVRALFEPHEGSLKVRGVFLTLYGDSPEDETYAPIQYSAICEILSNIMESEAETVRSDVSVFIKHYIEVIREASGMSDERREMETLARQLYRSHRKALDFIIEHGATTDFIMAVESVVGENPEHGQFYLVENQRFMFSWHGNNLFSFLPASWVENLGGDETRWKGCENWWAGFPLASWFELQPNGEGGSGRLRLFAEVGPLSDHDFRKKLIDTIAGLDLKNVKFQRGAGEAGKKYSKFLKNNDVVINEVQSIEEIENAIHHLLKRFKPVFEGVAGTLSVFAHHGVIEDD